MMQGREPERRRTTSNREDASMRGGERSGNTGVELAYDNQNIASLTTNAGVYASIAIGFPGGMTGFVNFRELVGYRDRSSHAVTLGVRFAF
jgi:hypothetical protein